MDSGWPDNVEAARHGQWRAARSVIEAATRSRDRWRGAGRREPRASFLLVVALVRLLAGALERGAENVAERGAGIGSAVLRDRLFLLGHFQRLDRHRHFARATIEL